MTDADIERQLESRIEALRLESGGQVSVDRVAEMVRALLASVGPHAGNHLLIREVEALAEYIHAAKAEIVAINPGQIKGDYIPSAAHELDAIIEATERATNDILDAAERIEEAQAAVDPETGGRLMEATTRIYEACNFQDITGQRITKVVGALKVIEERIDTLVAAFGGSGTGKGADSGTRTREGLPPARAVPEGEEGLLNGPQLPDKAGKQADVDKLFSSSEK